MYTREHCVCVFRVIRRRWVNTSWAACHDKSLIRASCRVTVEIIWNFYFILSFKIKKKKASVLVEKLWILAIFPSSSFICRLVNTRREREGGWVNMNDNTDAIYSFTHTHTEWLYMDIVAIVALLLSFVPSNSLYNISLLLQLCVCRLIGQ
jgi:hypothetical protein